MSETATFIQSDAKGNPIKLDRCKDQTRRIPAEHILDRCIDEVKRLPVQDSDKLKEVVNLLETAQELLTGYIESEEFRKPATVLITNVLNQA